MSEGELRRVEGLGGVKEKELKLVDAARLMEVSYRQAERLWKRYRKRGANGLQHGNAGRRSNRAKPVKFWNRVLELIRKK